MDARDDYQSYDVSVISRDPVNKLKFDMKLSLRLSRMPFIARSFVNKAAAGNMPDE